MKGFVETSCNIADIRPGDVVRHDGEIVTVSKNDIKSCPFMGVTFRGDSYRGGYKKIVKLVYVNPIE